MGSPSSSKEDPLGPHDSTEVPHNENTAMSAAEPSGSSWADRQQEYLVLLPSRESERSDTAKLLSSMNSSKNRRSLQRALLRGPFILKLVSGAVAVLILLCVARLSSQHRFKSSSRRLSEAPGSSLGPGSLGSCDPPEIDEDDGPDSEQQQQPRATSSLTGPRPPFGPQPTVEGAIRIIDEILEADSAAEAQAEASSSSQQPAPPVVPAVPSYQALTASAGCSTHHTSLSGESESQARSAPVSPSATETASPGSPGVLEDYSSDWDFDDDEEGLLSRVIDATFSDDDDDDDDDGDDELSLIDHNDVATPEGAPAKLKVHPVADQEGQVHLPVDSSIDSGSEASTADKQGGAAAGGPPQQPLDSAGRRNWLRSEGGNPGAFVHHISERNEPPRPPRPPPEAAAAAARAVVQEAALQASAARRFVPNPSLNRPPGHSIIRQILTEDSPAPQHPAPYPLYNVNYMLQSGGHIAPTMHQTAGGWVPQGHGSSPMALPAVAPQHRAPPPPYHGVHRPVRSIPRVATEHRQTPPPPYPGQSGSWQEQLGAPVTSSPGPWISPRSAADSTSNTAGTEAPTTLQTSGDGSQASSLQRAGDSGRMRPPPYRRPRASRRRQIPANSTVARALRFSPEGANSSIEGRANDPSMARQQFNELLSSRFAEVLRERLEAIVPASEEQSATKEQQQSSFEASRAGEDSGRVSEEAEARDVQAPAEAPEEPSPVPGPETSAQSSFEQEASHPSGSESARVFTSLEPPSGAEGSVGGYAARVPLAVRPHMPLPQRQAQGDGWAGQPFFRQRPSSSGPATAPQLVAVVLPERGSTTTAAAGRREQDGDQRPSGHPPPYQRTVWAPQQHPLHQNPGQVPSAFGPFQPFSPPAAPVDGGALREPTSGLWWSQQPSGSLSTGGGLFQGAFSRWVGHMGEQGSSREHRWAPAVAAPHPGAAGEGTQARAAAEPAPAEEPSSSFADLARQRLRAALRETYYSAVGDDRRQTPDPQQPSSTQAQEEDHEQVPSAAPTDSLRRPENPGPSLVDHLFERTVDSTARRPLRSDGDDDASMPSVPSTSAEALPPTSAEALGQQQSEEFFRGMLQGEEAQPLGGAVDVADLLRRQAAQAERLVQMQAEQLRLHELLLLAEDQLLQRELNEEQMRRDLEMLKRQNRYLQDDVEFMRSNLARSENRARGERARLSIQESQVRKLEGIIRVYQMREMALQAELRVLRQQRSQEQQQQQHALQQEVGETDSPSVSASAGRQQASDGPSQQQQQQHQQQVEEPSSFGASAASAGEELEDGPSTSRGSGASSSEPPAKRRREGQQGPYSAYDPSKSGLSSLITRQSTFGLPVQAPVRPVPDSSEQSASLGAAASSSGPSRVSPRPRPLGAVTSELASSSGGQHGITAAPEAVSSGADSTQQSSALRASLERERDGRSFMPYLRSTGSPSQRKQQDDGASTSAAASSVSSTVAASAPEEAEPDDRHSNVDAQEETEEAIEADEDSSDSTDQEGSDN